MIIFFRSQASQAYLPHYLLTLIDLTTLGRARFDPGSKPLPRPCRITKSQGVAERGDRGTGGGKCSFPAKRARIFEDETFVRVQGSQSFNSGRTNFRSDGFSGRKPPSS